MAAARPATGPIANAISGSAAGVKPLSTMISNAITPVSIQCN